VLAALIGATIIAGLLYGRHVVIRMQQRSALRQDGVEVQGEITFLKRVGKGGNIVRYNFAASGGTFSDKAEVPPELMRSLRESNSLTIRYLPSDPAINHPAAWEWSPSSEWPVIFILIGLLAVWSVGSAAIYRNRILLVWGKPAVGVVTKCRERSRGSISVKYEFRAESGEYVQGSGKSLISPEIGASIWILYLPQNPGRNLPYPVPGYDVDE
jgi:hypothetical protein